MKVPVLDLAIWVEEVKVSAPRMDDGKLHTACNEDSPYLPIRQDTMTGHSEVEETPESAKRMASESNLSSLENHCPSKCVPCWLYPALGAKANCFDSGGEQDTFEL